MRRKKKNHFNLYALLALTTFLLTIWFMEPWGETQKERVSQDRVEVEQENIADKTEPEPQEESEIDKEDSVEDDSEIEKEENVKEYDSMNLEEKVASIMDAMTLEEKIGQLMVVGFQSSEVDGHITQMIEDYHVGGVILYDRNMVNPRQVATLTNELQDLAVNNSKHPVPLMISVDQEGGSIVRMREQVSPIPSHQELGKRGNLEEIYSTAKRTGEELGAMGINVNYAPVLDLSSTDTRSFGLDPEKAYRFGKQMISGLADSQVAGAIKHFPGNGRSDIDPHVETSSVEADKMDLENNDIYPFKKMIETVDHDQFFVMVTHIKYPAYDQEKPASISPVIIQDLLREQLGYTGLVVTDDLEMGAVSKYFTYEDLGYEAVEAGVDLLLVCHTYEYQDQVFNGVLKAVQSGELSESRIDESVERILRYKLSHIQSMNVNPQTAEDIVGL
jgi:beta-N-acetylhexosaminidase